EKPDMPSPRQSSLTPSAQEPYVPISGKERAKWFVKATVGPQSLAAGLFTSGINTARDKPVEYGPGWEGFGKRYGMRLTGVATSSAIETSLGSIWGEDPRYFRTSGQSFGKRVRNVVIMTFMAKRADGYLAPAYARYTAIVGGNFLSNTWRADSEATSTAALRRAALGVVGRMTADAFKEFWPDLARVIHHR
ncbi:MAG: hypothetical protein ABLT11_06265, partial [Candidatus Acidiferrum sp.]